MSTRLRIFKETALPGSLVNHAAYFVAPAARPDFVEIYVTTSTGSVKRVIDEARVLELIAAAGSGASAIIYVLDIEERDELVLDANAVVWVADATDDETVESGGAKYFYHHASETWVKTGEEESMDLTISWGDITGRPTSAVADIDNAVSLRHSHANKTQLDKIDEDGDGNPTYDGSLFPTGWASTEW